MSFLENIDKNKLQKIVLIVISALTLAAITLLLTIIVMSISPKSPTVDQEIEFKTVAVEEKDILAGTLILADNDHKYAVDKNLLDLIDCQTYRDEQLTAAGVQIDETTKNKDYLPWKNMKLNKDAMVAAHKMLTDAKAAVKGEAITIDAAFDRIVYGGNDNEGYNTGLLMFLSDFTSDSGAYVKLSDDYSTWLKTNAAKYGFVNSFEDAYRYVGVTHATYMAQEKLSLADYINYLKKNHSADQKMLQIGDYGVYYVSCKTGDSINVPANNEYTISGTNEGGVIVTVKLK
jgi:D-alanyl-D-alanine carboxypeptidase